VLFTYSNIKSSPANTRATEEGEELPNTIDSNVKLLEVSVAESFIIPVYSISYMEPSGVLRDWLAWVQQRPTNDLPDGFKPIP